MGPDELSQIKRRIRLLQLLEAAEGAALAPIELRKLHAFVYLADVLSPVWNLSPFETRLAKTGRSPYFPDLQRELNALVVMGLIEVSQLRYSRLPGRSASINARFALRFESGTLSAILEELAEDGESIKTREYLMQLGNALATLRDEDIEAAATEDASYSDPRLSTQDVIEMKEAVERGSRTQTAVATFGKLFPSTQLPPARRLFMYAHYLGRRVHARE